MERITATIITRNEEQNIERCLNALSGVADEIIVVDSYSTDRTLEICRRYGCKITPREFTGFGSQRQYAAGLATNSFILSIDADEVLDEDLRAAIIKLKAEGMTHRVYSVEIKNYFCQRPLNHSGFEPHSQVRLFNKRYANWNLRDVSDKVTYPESVNPAPLAGCIHHYRCASRQEFNRKENRIAALQSKALAAANSSISPLTPLMRAAAQYFHCLSSHQAYLDGSTGLYIARRRAKTVYESWRMARTILSQS